MRSTAGGRLVGYDGREVPFDLAVVVPLHGGAEYVGRSPGLGDELDFVPTDEHTLQSKAAPNIFVIGDAAERARIEGRFGDALRGRDARRQRPTLPRGRTARARLRRSRQLLHRDRVPQGVAHRLQLRHRAADRSLPGPRRPATPEGVAAQPPRQAHVPVRATGTACCRAATSPASARPCPPRASTCPSAQRRTDHDHRHHRRCHRRPQRRRLLHRSRSVDRGDGARARARRGHRRADRRSLAA